MMQIHADNGSHRVRVEATCDQSGTPLRAPTANSGLSPLCKDSFYGKVRLQQTLLFAFLSLRLPELLRT